MTKFNKTQTDLMYRAYRIHDGMIVPSLLETKSGHYSAQAMKAFDKLVEAGMIEEDVYIETIEKEVFSWNTKQYQTVQVDVTRDQLTEAGREYVETVIMPPILEQEQEQAERRAKQQQEQAELNRIYARDQKQARAGVKAWFLSDLSLPDEDNFRYVVNTSERPVSWDEPEVTYICISIEIEWNYNGYWRTLARVHHRWEQVDVSFTSMDFSDDNMVALLPEIMQTAVTIQQRVNAYFQWVNSQ